MRFDLGRDCTKLLYMALLILHKFSRTRMRRLVIPFSILLLSQIMIASASDSPSPRFGAVMFFDTIKGRILLFGGASEGGANSYNDMWSYNYPTNTWTKVITSGTPSGRFEQSAVFNPNTAQLVTYGESSTGMHMWTFNVRDDTWSTLASKNLPSPPRANTPLVYDVRYDRIMMFSGMSMEATTDRFPEDTWAYDPTLNRWNKMNPDASPEGHYGHSFVYDPVNVRALMMGGHWWSSINPSEDYVSEGLWSYDYGLDSWTLIDDTQIPTKRHYHACAVNTDTGELVVFGGNTSGRDMSDDTWIWIHGEWKQVSSETHPTARMLATMAYDPVNKVMLLFGGMDKQAHDLNDLWALDGEGHWKQVMVEGGVIQPTGGATESSETKPGISGYPIETTVLALLLSIIVARANINKLTSRSAIRNQEVTSLTSGFGTLFEEKRHPLASACADLHA